MTLRISSMPAGNELRCPNWSLDPASRDPRRAAGCWTGPGSPRGRCCCGAARAAPPWTSGRRRGGALGTRPAHNLGGLDEIVSYCVSERASHPTPKVMFDTTPECSDDTLGQLRRFWENSVALLSRTDRVIRYSSCGPPAPACRAPDGLREQGRAPGGEPVLLQLHAAARLEALRLLVT